MAGHTSRLNLYLPGGGSSGLYLPDEQLDIDRINDNMKLLDAAMGYQIVTSTTRPATPFVGQPIFETDTKRTPFWDGAGWNSYENRIIVASIGERDALTAPVLRDGLRCFVLADGVEYLRLGGWVDTRSGRVRVIPTAASAPGGTATIGSNGEVVITGGATEFSIDGVFPTSIKRFEIVGNVDSTVATNLNMNFRAAGANVSAAYFSQIDFPTSTSAIGGAQPSNNAAIAQITGLQGTNHVLQGLISRPSLAAVTMGQLVVSARGGPGLRGQTRTTVEQNSTTVLDGLRISTVSGGTLAGSELSIYGLI